MSNHESAVDIPSEPLLKPRGVENESFLNKLLSPFSDPRTPRLVGCVVGIIGSLMAYGVFQERIMSQPYGEPGNEERFSYSVFLVLNSRLAAAFVALLVLLGSGESVKNVAPIYKYFAVSVSNVFATTCQYEALKYVNFPTQTLGKCAKMIPVMIWGSVLSKKKYTINDYSVAFFVTVGSTVFMLSGDLSSGSAHGDKSTSVYGLLLMVGYLGFDGFTSTWQSKLFSSYKMSTYNQMLYVNLCSGALSFAGLFSSGQLFEALAFLQRHPSLATDAAILSFSAVFGQFVITYTIKEFGALVFATVMTTRQFLSILFSCMWFAHPLTHGQWLGTVMVFGALYYKTYAGHKAKQARAAQPAPSS